MQCISFEKTLQKNSGRKLPLKQSMLYKKKQFFLIIGFGFEQTSISSKYPSPIIYFWLNILKLLFQSRPTLYVKSYINPLVKTKKILSLSTSIPLQTQKNSRQNYAQLLTQNTAVSTSTTSKAQLRLLLQMSKFLLGS